MNKNLSDKLNSLSPKEKSIFYTKLMNILNDRYSCFAYGGVNDKEYSDLPEEKLEKIKERVYEETFNYKIFRRICSLKFHYFVN